MSQPRKRPAKTLLLGMIACLALVVGVASIFDLPADSWISTLVSLFIVVFLVILLGLVMATLIAWLRRILHKRQ